VTSNELLQEELFDGDSEQQEAESVPVLPLAQDANSPIPALREVTAQVVKLGSDGKARAASSGEDDEDGEAIVVLEDPEGLAPKPAALSMWAYALATFFDGRRSAAQAVEAFAEKFKQPVPVQHALDLQNELDRALFLYSSRFEKVLKRQIRSYLDDENRAPAHAGSAYPAETEALEKTLLGFFETPDGPNGLPTRNESDTVRALMLPHIDLRVGGATYAHGYAELIKKCQADLFIVLGVAHQAACDGLYYVSQKNYVSPAGVAKTNQAIDRRLQKASGVPVPMAEMAHRTEHSVEFQAVLLSSLLTQQKRDFEIVPVLCGPIETFLANEESPLNDEGFRRFADALREELETCKRKWCVICSVDLSHVGPEFGHSAMMTDKLLLPVERGDRKWLKKVESLDANAAYEEILRTQNSRHIDAVLATLTMLDACRGKLKSAKLLHYDQMLKENSHSAVSYAAMSFES